MIGGRRSTGAAVRLLAVAVVAGAAALGCTQTVLLERPDINDGGMGTGGAGGDGSPWPPGGCPNSQLILLSTQTRSPDVIIALDRSSSMSNNRFGGDSGSRLVGTQQVLQKLLPMYQNAIRFGYEEFPSSSSTTGCFDPGGCCAGDVYPQPKPQGADGIKMAMGTCSKSPAPSNCVNSNESPSGNAISAVRDFYSTYDDHVSDRYVLLITDGEPTCYYDNSGNPNPALACSKTTTEISELASMGMETIVVGVGDDVTPGNTCLESMAVQGSLGHPRPPLYAHDSAALQTGLTEVLDELAGSACRITLRPSLVDPSTIQVWIGGIPVQQSTTNGWSFDPQSSVRITINGMWCDTLQGKYPVDLEVYACAPGPGH